MLIISVDDTVVDNSYIYIYIYIYVYIYIYIYTYRFMMYSQDRFDHQLAPGQISGSMGELDRLRWVDFFWVMIKEDQHG